MRACSSSSGLTGAPSHGRDRAPRPIGQPVETERATAYPRGCDPTDIGTTPIDSIRTGSVCGTSDKSTLFFIVHNLNKSLTSAGLPVVRGSSQQPDRAAATTMAANRAANCPL